MEIWISLTTAIIGALLLYWCYIATYFKRLSIPYCAPLPLIGNFLPLICRRKKFVDIIQEYYDRWPNAKYFGIFNFTQPVIVIRDPEVISSITIRNFDNFMDHHGVFDEGVEPMFCKNLHTLKGDKWYSVRSALTPSFNSNKMKMMYELMANCSKSFAEIVIINATEEGTYLEIDIKEAISRYTNDVIATCTFGIAIDSMQYPENEFYEQATKLSGVSSSRSIKALMLYYFPGLSKFLGLKLINGSTRTFFRNVVEEAVRNRIEKGAKRSDMIQLMMEIKEIYNEVRDSEIEDMVAQSSSFFFGGFRNCVTLTSFVCMEIATNKDVQRRLQEEIDIALKNSDGNPTFETVNEMPYLEAVLYEALRYYPNVLTLERACTAEFELPPPTPGHERVTIQPGTRIWIAANSIHHDPKYHDDPHTFDPDRFINNPLNINQCTFLAFGIGPRSCIGRRFALLGVKLFLFYLLARCDLKPTDKTPVPLKFSQNKLDLTFENGFKLQIDARKHSYFGSGLDLEIEE